MSNSGTKEPSPGVALSPTSTPPLRGRDAHETTAGAHWPPTPKRPRGRPRGSKNKGPRATPKKVEPVGERRPRGRPRKWPQKVVQEVIQEQQGPSEETEGPSQSRSLPTEASPSQAPAQEEAEGE